MNIVYLRIIHVVKNQFVVRQALCYTQNDGGSGVLDNALKFKTVSEARAFAYTHWSGCHVIVIPEPPKNCRVRWEQGVTKYIIEAKCPRGDQSWLNYANTEWTQNPMYAATFEWDVAEQIALTYQ